MIKIISASADNYITNRVITKRLRALDANVGSAGTLDLFKLYNESTFIGEDAPIEVSRILIKFDLGKISALTSSILDTNDPTFKCTLRLADVYGGQATPHNFSVILHPLSRSFDEGVGRDIIRFDDVDASNFLTASYANGSLVKWVTQGAAAEGAVGQEVDIISSANFGSGFEPTTVVQRFQGAEDLVMDVTKIVSGTLAGILPNCGFRIAFSGSQETDSKTRFVKRFSSRHVPSPARRPQLFVSIDDSISDNHSNMTFDVTGSLFLRNSVRNVMSNFLSGSAATQITGSNCMTLRLVSGTFSSSYSVSQAVIGRNFLSGMYKASLAVSRFREPLFSHLKSTTSASFTEIWGSNDGSVGFYTGSLQINTSDVFSYKPQTRSLYARITNCKSEYSVQERPRFIIFIEDLDEEVVFSRYPRENNGHVYDSVYYSVKDAVTGDIVVHFLTENAATRVSSADDGMYFDFHMDALTPGRTYEFRVLIRDMGEDLVLDGVSPKFRVTV